MESVVLESAPWRCVEAAPAILFSLERTRSSRASRPPKGGGASIAVAEGRAELLDGGALVLEGEDDAVTLRFTLPPVVDLRPLLGRFARITLRSRPSDGRDEQLLTLADAKGRVRLVAHFGRAQGEVHVVGATTLRAALSQRPGGPMVFGTSQLQCLVRVGEQVTVRDGETDLVMHFAARTAAGHAAYVVVDRALFAG